MKKITFLFFFLTLSLGFSQAPATGPTAPPVRDAGDVVSFYGGNDNSYTNVANVNFVAFGGGGTIVGDLVLGDGQTVIEYANHAFSGIGQGSFDVSQMEFLHIDFYSPVATNFRIKLESPGQALELDAPTAPVAGQWMSYDIDLSLYPNVNFADLFYLIPVTNSVPGGVPMFLDNIYFYRAPIDPATDARLSALEVDSNPINGFASSVLTYEFPVPAGTTVVPQITTATATQAGANVVINQATSVPGTATVVVTSSDTSTSQTYTVNIVETGPNGPAPTPPARDAQDVISIFSPAYADVASSAIQTFAGGVYENFTVVNPDDTRKLTASPGGGFQIQFFDPAAALDLTAMTTFHVDLWFDDAGSIGSELSFRIQNFSAPGPPDNEIFTNINVENAGAGAWVSVDVDITAFNNYNASNPINSIRQVIFTSQGAAFGPTYLTNIYFYKDNTASTNDFLLDTVKVSPNPSKDVWNIQSSNVSIGTVEVFDILGKRVLNLSPNSQEVRIDASTLKTGIYLAKLSSNGATKTIKLVKN